MADDPMRPTPEQVRAAWEFLTGLSSEDVEQGAATLRRKVASQHHALAGVASITVTASGTLGVATSADPVPVPAAIAEAAGRPISDAETALGVIVLWLAVGALSSALAGRPDVAEAYEAAILTVTAMYGLLKLSR